MAKRDTSTEKKPNILIIWGDDIGQSNLSCYSKGVMGYRTPNIDRIANEGMIFTDYYGEQSCTAGRSAFITGQSVFRTGLSKVGIPGATLGMRAEDPTIADLLKPLGYATGQFGKNHLGDKDEHLPTMHGFDEFFGNLYHFNAEEEPELRDYPPEKDFPNFKKNYGPRGVLHCWARPDGTQKIENTGPLTKKRMETVDEEFLAAAKDFITKANKSKKPFFVWFNTTHMHFRTHAKPREPGTIGALAVRISRRDDRPRQACRQVIGPARRTGHRRQHVRHVQHGQRAAYELLAGRGHDAVPSTRRTRTGRAPTVCRQWCAGRERSRRARSRMRSSATWTGCRRSWPWRASRHQGEAQEGDKAGDKTFKVHLDGYNLLPYLTGRGQEPAPGYFYLLGRRRPHGVAL